MVRLLLCIARAIKSNRTPATITLGSFHSPKSISGDAREMLGMLWSRTNTATLAHEYEKWCRQRWPAALVTVLSKRREVVVGGPLPVCRVGLPSGFSRVAIVSDRTIYNVVSRRRRLWWTSPEWQPGPFVRFAVYRVAVDYLIFNCSRGAFRYLTSKGDRQTANRRPI